MHLYIVNKNNLLLNVIHPGLPFPKFLFNLFPPEIIQITPRVLKHTVCFSKYIRRIQPNVIHIVRDPPVFPNYVPR